MATSRPTLTLCGGVFEKRRRMRRRSAVDTNAVPTATYTINVGGNMAAMSPAGHLPLTRLKICSRFKATTLFLVDLFLNSASLAFLTHQARVYLFQIFLQSTRQMKVRSNSKLGSAIRAGETRDEIGSHLLRTGVLQYLSIKSPWRLRP